MDIIKSNNSESKFSSVFLTEQINVFRREEENHSELRHSDLLIKIESEFEEEIGQRLIPLTSYKDKSNRDSKCYELTFDESLQILMRESKTVRKKCVQVMRKKPKTRLELARENLSLIEEIEYKDQLLLEAKPKAEFYDQVTGSSDTIDMASVAKILNIPGFGRNLIFDELRKKSVLQSNNQPYQKYVDNGWFRVIESKYAKSDGSTHISLKTVVYQKGLDGIRKLLSK